MDYKKQKQIIKKGALINGQQDSDGNFVVPENVYRIDAMAFSCRRNMKNIKLNEGLEYIGNDAFFDCRSLKSIEFPKSLKFIGREAFAFASDMDKVVFPDGISFLPDKMGYGGFPNNTFLACSGVKEIYLPDSLTKNIDRFIIGESVFANCRGLEKIRLPKGLKEIKANAFENCKSLTEIEIPEGVDKMGYGVFDGCRRLKEITLPASLGIKGALVGGKDNIFENVSRIYVPEKTLEKWKAEYPENQKYFFSLESKKELDYEFSR